MTVQAPSPSAGTTGDASASPTGSAEAKTAAATSSASPSNGVKVSAFVTPGADRGSDAVLVGTDYLVGFTRSEAANAVMEYLTSQDWARTRMAMGGVATAYQGVDPDLAPSDVGKRATRLLQSRETTVEMDASDSMPVGVGSSALWLGLSRWSTGAMSAREALAQGESAWPKQK